MLARILVVAQNTYREAVRARLLLGLFLVAFATAGYCQIVGMFALKSSLRVVSDLGAASVSLYSVVVAIILGATSLHRELELKTIFPILARPIRRDEYLVGKYFGALMTLAVFIAANAAVLILSLSMVASERYLQAIGILAALAGSGALLARQAPRTRTFIPAFAAVLLLIIAWPLASGAPDDRRVIVSASLLSLAEVAVITALATLFSSFSSPFLTAIFTFGVFVIGRSADTLSRLPERVFGKVLHTLAVGISKVVPNLMVYVPPRPLLTGEVASVPIGQYIGLAVVQALAWSIGLLAVAAVIFRRRDFL
jgi:ABC-type transport system involved in multi-copper enzyme maturation permease subunit